MQYLVPYILSCDIVDRYDIWVHTYDLLDIEFFKKLADQYEKVNLVWQPDGIVSGNKTINPFYRYCIEPNTIYFKIDDDVIWMEQDAIRKMVEFRLKNKQYLVVSPLIINNPICSYLLEVNNKLPIREHHLIGQIGEIYWQNGAFAYELHRWFLESKIDNVDNLYIGKRIISTNRFSINAILWFGSDFGKIGKGGEINGDDEEYISCRYPASIGMENAINGGCIMSHYAFFTQRNYLDKTDILARYAQYYSKARLSLYNKYLAEISEMLKNINKDKMNILT